MATTEKASVLRVAIVTDSDTPVYEYDFIPPTGRAVPPVRFQFIPRSMISLAVVDAEYAWGCCHYLFLA
jgi:hypothetical protein